MPRHDQEQHFVRPDRVYATSVLSPIVGYQPAEDAMQVGARFVSGGQGLGFPHFRFKRPLPIRLFRGLGAPSLNLFSWIRDRWAAVKARVEVKKMVRDLRYLPAAPAQVTLDTSPRPPAPYPGALMTKGGWAPAPQSPATAANAITRGAAGREAPPILPALDAGNQLAPQAIGFPIDYWKSIREDYPGTVGVRSEHDALRAFYANRMPGAGY
jgi:hypothetical protein